MFIGAAKEIQFASQKLIDITGTKLICCPPKAFGIEPLQGYLSSSLQNGSNYSGKRNDCKVF